jgi:hypothetical protein
VGAIESFAQRSCCPGSTILNIHSQQQPAAGWNLTSAKRRAKVEVAQSVGNCHQAIERLRRRSLSAMAPQASGPCLPGKQQLPLYVKVASDHQLVSQRTIRSRRIISSPTYWAAATRTAQVAWIPLGILTAACIMSPTTNNDKWPVNAWTTLIAGPSFPTQQTNAAQLLCLASLRDITQHWQPPAHLSFALAPQLGRFIDHSISLRDRKQNYLTWIACVQAGLVRGTGFDTSASEHAMVTPEMLVTRKRRTLLFYYASFNLFS